MPSDTIWRDKIIEEVIADYIEYYPLQSRHINDTYKQKLIKENGKFIPQDIQRKATQHRTIFTLPWE